MNQWVLGIELNGEWEHCSFATQQEALASFAALSRDYVMNMGRAVLFRQSSHPETANPTPPRYLN